MTSHVSIQSSTLTSLLPVARSCCNVAGTVLKRVLGTYRTQDCSGNCRPGLGCGVKPTDQPNILPGDLGAGIQQRAQIHGSSTKRCDFQHFLSRPFHLGSNSLYRAIMGNLTWDPERMGQHTTSREALDNQVSHAHIHAHPYKLSPYNTSLCVRRQHPSAKAVSITVSQHN